MSEKSYKVETVSPAQANALLRRMKSGPENLFGRSSISLDGLEMVGEFSIIAKDVRSGEVEWEHSDKNLITDLGRRAWMEGRFSNCIIAFSPSSEVPQSGRYSVGTDGTQCFASAGIAPTNAPATHTKTFSVTFGTPATTRTLGSIHLCRNSTAVETNKGIVQMMAFALLSPPKTQTTTQTLEVVYKVSMNPIA